VTEILYTTDDLSRMFGVGKSTIKRWSDEGKLHCYKTPGGHRKFKSSSVQKFMSHYNYETLNSENVLSFKMQKQEIIQYNALDNRIIELSIDDAIKGRHESIEKRLMELFGTGLNLSAILDSFLTTVLRKIHLDQFENKISTIEFQIAKNTLIHSLIHFADLIPKSEDKNIEMYCLSVNEGLNEVELKAVELLLENLGINVYNLGTVLTKYAAEDIVHQCKPEDVFIVLSTDKNSQEVVQQFTTLVNGVHNYGGQVYSSNFLNDNTENVHSVDNGSIHLKSFSEIVHQITLNEKVA
jgi:MerR family transcriptional regulator, light-induced transcriptional regulator